MWMRQRMEEGMNLVGLALVHRLADEATRNGRRGDGLDNLGLLLARSGLPRGEEEKEKENWRVEEKDLALLGQPDGHAQPSAPHPAPLPVTRTQLLTLPCTEEICLEVLLGRLQRR